MKAPYLFSLSEELINELNHYAQQLGVPKDELIERAIQYYLKELKRTEYIESFKRAQQDKEQMDLADMGLEDALNILKNS
jgi:metal-responsive CopG/Arc/MetJ family transcriptional regulator